LLLPHQISQRNWSEYVKAFAYLDATNIDVLYIDKREEAAEAVLTRLKAADIVIFTGGDQLLNLGGLRFKIFY
jgi:cyanophycinase